MEMQENDSNIDTIHDIHGKSDRRQSSHIPAKELSRSNSSTRAGYLGKHFNYSYNVI